MSGPTCRVVALLTVLSFAGGCAGSDRPGEGLDGLDAGGVDPADFRPDRFLQAGDVTLHYLDWGGEGDLLLLLAGITGTAHAYHLVAPRLTDRHRVVALTRRNHGASGKTSENFDLDDLADDIAAALEALGEDAAVVVGWSYAGVEMARLYQRHPDRVQALVFLDALYDWSRAPENEPPLPGQPVLDSVYPAFDDVRASLFGQAETEAMSAEQMALVDAYLRSVVEQGDDGRFRWVLPLDTPAAATFLGLMGAWSPDELAGISVPVLAVRVEAGEALAQDLARRGFSNEDQDAARRWAREVDDPRKRAATDALLRHVPDARVVVLDSVTHGFPMTHPDLVEDLLEDFLAELGPPPAGR